MKRLMLFSGVLAMLTTTNAGAAEARPGATPGASEIVARNLSARGGSRAWQAVRSMKLSGEMDVGGKADTRVPFVLALARPNRSRLEITFEGKNAIQAYDGAKGWKVRPFLNRDDVEPFTAAEAASAASADELDGPLVDHERKGTRVELAGVDMIEGRKNFRLVLTSRSGEKRTLWVDASTFLETKISGEPRKLDGRPHKVEVVFRDYRTVNGLKVPFVLETVVEGLRKTRKMTIKSVAIDPQLDDALFARPAVAVARVGGG